MRSNRQLIARILGTFLILSSVVDGRRRSRIDSPIASFSDAPLEDNLATASDSDVAFQKVEAPVTKSSKNETEVKETLKAAPTDDKECKSDNISFELVTGYV